MPRGGRRAGAGRPRGAVSQRAREMADALSGVESPAPMRYLLALLNNEEAEPARRDWAAQALMPFMCARIGPINPEPSRSEAAPTFRLVSYRRSDERPPQEIEGFVIDAAE